MKAWELLGESSAPDGTDIQLRRRDDEYLILARGKPLMSSDRRVRIQATDVGFTLRANPGRFDVVLLDTDNGPTAFTAADNAGLYDNAGVAAAFAALRPSGTLAVWSAWDDRKFEQRLRFYGFLVEVARVRARLHRGGPRHTIFVAHKSLAVS